MKTLEYPSTFPKSSDDSPFAEIHGVGNYDGIPTQEVLTEQALDMLNELPQSKKLHEQIQFTEQRIERVEQFGERFEDFDEAQEWVDDLLDTMPRNTTYGYDQYDFLTQKQLGRVDTYTDAPRAENMSLEGQWLHDHGVQVMGMERSGIHDEKSKGAMLTFPDVLGGRWVIKSSKEYMESMGDSGLMPEDAMSISYITGEGTEAENIQMISMGHEPGYYGKKNQKSIPKTHTKRYEKMDEMLDDDKNLSIRIFSRSKEAGEQRESIHLAAPIFADRSMSELRWWGELKDKREAAEGNMTEMINAAKGSLEQLYQQMGNELYGA